MRKRNITAVLCLTAVAGIGSATPALAHQHLFNPSGNCPSANSNVPQGLNNPAGNTPGGRNNAFGNEQGTANCSNG